MVVGRLLVNEPRVTELDNPQRGLYATNHKDFERQWVWKQPDHISHPSTKLLPSRLQIATREMSCKAAQSRPFANKFGMQTNQT